MSKPETNENIITSEHELVVPTDNFNVDFAERDKNIIAYLKSRGITEDEYWIRIINVIQVIVSNTWSQVNFTLELEKRKAE